MILRKYCISGVSQSCYQGHNDDDTGGGGDDNDGDGSGEWQRYIEVQHALWIMMGSSYL
jgi:hypothetical protein